jgi:hypothetical protein
MSLGFFEEPGKISLPHPPIPLALFLIIESALCAAWELVRTKPGRPGFDLKTAKENEITLELQEAVFDRVFNSGIVPGFDRQVFSGVIRDQKLRNYNYTSLDKMPDLTIGLINRPAGIINSQDFIFVECKPVDAAHGAGGHYCDKGIRRFVVGDYAWTMTNALMIAYTVKPYTISPKLYDALQARATTLPTLSGPDPCTFSSAGPHSEVVYISEHSRSFIYRETPKAAGPIIIRHLWLSRD